MIRVLVVDDQSLIRQAVAGLLEAHPEIEVVGEAADGAAAVRAVTALRPDVVLMDIRMPVMDGIAATAAICSASDASSTRVLVLTTFEEDAYVVAALRAGASGFIGKGADPEEIARAVIAVHSGETLLSPAATHGLVSRYVLGLGGIPVNTEVAQELAQLTEREREVLLLVARGRSNQEIADELFISPHTAKTHVNRIMVKVRAHDRAQLVILAYESGLLAPGSSANTQ